MSDTAALQRRADELRAIVTAPSPAEELAAVEAQLAGAREVEAQAAAARWALGNVRAIGGAVAELDRMFERPAETWATKDVATANRIWARIVRRLELAEVIQRRFPHATLTATPTVLPPGRRGLDAVTGLSIATPRRQLFPVVIASDSPALRAALFAVEAHAWLVGRGAELPEELRAVLAVAPPEPDLAERIARDRVETQRQAAAAFRAARAV